jgi:hypothetical protein
MAHTAETICAHLNAGPNEFIRGLAEADVTALRGLPHVPAREKLREALAAPIPPLTYSLYREFSKNGNRGGYEDPLFERDRLLGRAVLAAWLYDEPGAVDRVCDLVWLKCEETSWVIPAAEPNHSLDLVASTAGADLAYTVHLLGERIPREVRDRVYAEVDRRVLAPYLERGDGYWWAKGGNNWTGVCAGSIGEAFLLLETDPDRQARGLELVLRQLGRFIEHGFAPDGASLEGVMYWNYGLTYLVSFSETLRTRTAGAIDLLGHPKLAKIARYPHVAQMDTDRFASFADAGERQPLQPYLAAVMAERAALPSLLALADTKTSPSPRKGVLDLLWWDGRAPDSPPLHDELMPESGLGKLVGELSGVRTVVCAKAGHNAEPHNHNDVGSFVLRARDVTYLCDPGAGRYDNKYFNIHYRYENVFANSYGHSVPRIGGHLQPHGDMYRGAIERLDGTGLRITMHEAYDLDELAALERTLRFEDDALVLEDVARFNGDGLPFETALVTWEPVETAGNVARILSKNGALRLDIEGAEFAVESLDEASKANRKLRVLKRITAAYAPAREVRSRIVMTLEP